jgi:hypothetical protein
MNSDRFKVIFTGKLKQDADINRVANTFAIRFKRPPEKALKKLAWKHAWKEPCSINIQKRYNASMPVLKMRMAIIL